MKPLKEIQKELNNELINHLDNIKSINDNLDYYNESLGDTSFILGCTLELHLNKQDDWDSKKWIDDSLLTKVKLIEDKLAIWGVIIWGIDGTTEQWTEPFYFEITLDENKAYFLKYTFLFGDSNDIAISYEDFKYNRDYWDRQYYQNDDWNPADRDWKYIISSPIV